MVRNELKISIVFVSSVLLWSACGEDVEFVESCEAGWEQSCSCDGGSGTQTCNADGVYGACECESVNLIDTISGDTNSDDESDGVTEDSVAIDSTESDSVAIDSTDAVADNTDVRDDRDGGAEDSRDTGPDRAFEADLGEAPDGAESGSGTTEVRFINLWESESAYDLYASTGELIGGGTSYGSLSNFYSVPDGWQRFVAFENEDTTRPMGCSDWVFLDDGAKVSLLALGSEPGECSEDDPDGAIVSLTHRDPANTLRLVHGAADPLVTVRSGTEAIASNLERFSEVATSFPVPECSVSGCQIALSVSTTSDSVHGSNNFFWAVNDPDDVPEGELTMVVLGDSAVDHPSSPGAPELAVFDTSGNMRRIGQRPTISILDPGGVSNLDVLFGPGANPGVLQGMVAEPCTGDCPVVWTEASPGIWTFSLSIANDQQARVQFVLENGRRYLIVPGWTQNLGERELGLHFLDDGFAREDASEARMRVLNLSDSALKYGRTFGDSIIDVTGLERVETSSTSDAAGAVVPTGSWGVHIVGADGSYDTCNFGVSTDAGTRWLMISIDAGTPLMADMSSFPFLSSGQPVFAVCP